MGGVLKAVSYIFHPLLIPFAGTLAYFFITPKYSPEELQTGHLLPIAILTIFIPILAYLILYRAGFVSSLFLHDIRERKYPFIINCSLLFMVMYKVIPYQFTPELYYFFLGLLISQFAAFILLYFNFKASMHLMGLGNLILFLIALSIHFEINITLAIGTFIFFAGFVATSRLYLKAHNGGELLIGFLIGLLAQLLLIKFWL
ncbi:MAG: hypothetical protein AB3N16_06975 [Flavobacteriaceae bacterium]